MARGHERGKPQGKGPGHGHRRGGTVVTAFRTDPESFEEVRAFALKRNVSLAEAIRLLVEWGLESYEETRND